MRSPGNSRRSLLAIVIFTILIPASSAFGAAVTKLSGDAFAPLRTRVNAKIRIDKLPLYDSKRSVIDLEEFEVWAPGAKIVIHGDNGVVLQELDPPPMRFFRGLVNGDPESFAYFSTNAAGDVQGLIVTREKKFSVATQRRPNGRAPERIDEALVPADTFLTEFNDLDGLDDARSWQCQVDQKMIGKRATPIRATGLGGNPIVAQGISGTQAYAIRVEIYTDNELYMNAGSNSATLTNYIVNLTGAASTIYNRDLKTNITQGNLNIYTSASDGWNASTADAGLREIGNYIHDNPTAASNVLFFSGRNVPSGIAWSSVACGVEFLCSGGNCGPGWDGSYGGPYSWSGQIGIGGLGTIPDPNATRIDGVLYGMPSGNQNYWPLEVYTHELGHNLAGRHTHCIALTPAEVLAAGRSFVDNCANFEGGCYSGAQSAPPEKGTIMSYCHNIFSGGFPQSRFTFGQAVEVSHHELDDYMLRVGGPVDASGDNIVTGVGSFTISAITAASAVGANSTGNVASITPIGGATYAWTISAGTITSVTTTNTAGITYGTTASLTYTAPASGTVTLRVAAFGTNRCGVTDTKLVTVTTSFAPTNLVATATTSTNINLTWSAGAGATSYRVYRSSDGTNYVLRGSPTGTSFDDAVTAGNAYLYRVRSFNGSIESPDSNTDLAYAFIFTDPTITTGAGGTNVKAVHITQLRTAVNAVRTQLTVLGAAVFTTDPTLTTGSGGTLVKAAHITQLRTPLDQARSALLLPAIVYTDPTITAITTIVKRAHITDLRGGVQ